MKASKIISVLHRDIIEEIAVGTELFSIADIEEESGIFKKNASFVQHILSYYSEPFASNVEESRKKLLLLLIGFHNTLAVSDQMKLEKVLSGEGYVHENGSFRHIDEIGIEVVFEDSGVLKLDILEADKKPVHKKVYIRNIGDGYFSNVSIPVERYF
ncbi:hypothetical protein NV381_37320 [Paenibacillus sp. N5-1-1-5]|uniref:Uncharacterized protein n=2 Tax=Paenibacillus radicis (ex Xue et al. 2023) TaxID=2972489 RepID=A0ABT1YV77_9BACL|nr:hypothetical protein [Paenibacillus radicis (ex Xue et al. 2023)]